MRNVLYRLEVFRDVLALAAVSPGSSGLEIAIPENKFHGGAIELGLYDVFELFNFAIVFLGPLPALALLAFAALLLVLRVFEAAPPGFVKKLANSLDGIRPHALRPLFVILI